MTFKLRGCYLPKFRIGSFLKNNLCCKATERPKGSAMRILVVDDDTGTLNALRVSLISAGHEVITAKDSHQALSTMKSYIKGLESIDLMVTDFKMPGMNGLELIRKVKKENPKLPVILMTAYGSARIRSQLFELGACKYLEKPFNPETLLAKINELYA